MKIIFFSLFLKAFFLLPSGSAYCNYNNFFNDDRLVNDNYRVDEIAYGSISNEKIYDNINNPETKSIKILAISAFMGANTDRTLILMNLYSKKIFKTVQTNAVNMSFTSKGELLYLVYPGKQLMSFYKYNFTVISTANNPIISYTVVTLDNVVLYLYIEQGSRQIFDQNHTTYISETDMLTLGGWYPNQFFSKMNYDPIYFDLYLSIGTDVLVYDLRHKRIWYRYTGHSAVVVEIVLIKSTVKDKFCIISLEKAPYGTTLQRWRPSFELKTQAFERNLILAEKEFHTSTSLSYTKVFSVVKAYNQDYIVIAGYWNPTTTEIAVLSHDLTTYYKNFYYYQSPSSEVRLMESDPYTDIFFLYERTVINKIVAFSLFASPAQGCAICPIKEGLYFFPMTGGCSNTCNYTKNLYFCEPSCSMQNCLKCDAKNPTVCEACELSSYLATSRGLMTVDCLPKYKCSRENETYSDTNICSYCDPSCKTCIGTSANQCLSCYSGNFYDATSASCIPKGNCPTFTLQINAQTDICVKDSVCPFGSYTNGNNLCDQKCDTNCETCSTNATFCTSCSGDMVLHNGKCLASCPQGYYSAWPSGGDSSNRSCLPCKGCSSSNTYCTQSCNYLNCLLPNCSKCDATDPTNCLTCNGYRLNNSCYLSCPGSYYPDNTTMTCKSCMKDCGNCTQVDQCLECKLNFYLSMAMCNQCNTSCLGCVGLFSNCLACASSKDFHDLVSPLHSCDSFCPESSFGDAESMTCKKCDANCKECVGYANNCSACSMSNTYLLFNVSNSIYYCGDCPEKNGMHVSADKRMCDQNPLNCKVYDLGKAECLECYPNFNVSAGECKPCNSSCSICKASAVQECIQCQNTSHFLQELTGVCYEKCPSHTYTSANYPNTCASCVSQCKECFGIQINCTSCDLNYALKYDSFLNVSNCVAECGLGYFLNNASMTCGKCPGNCEACSSEIFCDTCIYGYKRLLNGSCLSNCAAGSYEDSSHVCQACSASCKECYSNANTCTSCEATYFWQNSCYNQCPGGTFTLNQTHCGKCDVTACAACEGTANFCTSCANNSLTLVNGNCILQCPEGYFPDKNACVQCSTNCILCTNLQNCLLCQTNSYLLDGYCLSSCGKGYYSTSKAFNSSLFGLVCYLCEYSCERCQNATYCFACKNSLYLYGDSHKCYDSCPKGRFSVDTQGYRTCDMCAGGCEACKANAYNCSQCVGLLTLTRVETNNSYVCSKCDMDGYFPSLVDTFEAFISGVLILCKQCTPNCKVCSSGTQCRQCLNGYKLLLNGECQIVCSKYFYPENNVCKTCDSTQFFYEHQPDQYICTQNCTGSFGKYSYIDSASRKICKNCSANCVLCINATTCVLCNSGYNLTQTNLCLALCPSGSFYSNALNTCQKCSDPCLTCDSEASHCTRCDASKGYTLFQSSCVFKSCAQNCTDCQSGQPSNCTQCLAGYSLVNSSCRPPKVCEPNCFDCLSENTSQCIICAAGYKFYRGKCYSECPMRTYESELADCLDCATNNCENCVKAGCLNCSQGYYLNTNGQCNSNCLENEFLNEATKRCGVCHANCLSCYGNESSNCLSCRPPLYLKGTNCLTPPTCLNNPCNVSEENFTIVLYKSPYISNEFFVEFSLPVEIAEYVNLKSLLEVEVAGVNESLYDYEVQRVPNNQRLLLVKLMFKQTVSNPEALITLSPYWKEFIRGSYNSSLNYNANDSSSNITLKTVTISSESKETQKVKQKITHETFIALAYIFVSCCIASYMFESKRSSLFWFFCDFIQFVAIMNLFNLNYDERLADFFKLLYVFHGDFFTFAGKYVEERTGQVFYFQWNITENYKAFDFLGIFKKQLGTNCFLANGMNAFLLLISFNAFLMVLKLYLKLHKKTFESEEGKGVYGVLMYFYSYVGFSVLIRLVQFFFYIIVLSAFIQFYAWDLQKSETLFGLLIGVFSLVYYLIFFIWLSRKVINNKEVYEDEDERWKYEAVFHGLEKKRFVQRNHFMLVHFMKFLRNIFIISVLSGMTTLISMLLFLQVIAVLRYAKHRPFTTFKLNLLNLLTEVGLLAIIIILLPIAQNQANREQGTSIVISSAAMDELTKASDGVISFACIVLGMYCVLSILLLIFYLMKNIDCICFLFFHQALPEEDEEVIMESFEEKNMSPSEKEAQKYKIPKRKDLREVAEEETQKKKYLEVYKKEHIIKVG